LVLYCSRLSDIASSADSPDEADSATSLLDLLTPVAKSWPSQWCLEANDLAIQVHGGYGYTREYDVEQHYRDNRLNPIHEGTHGIQSLDLLGRKVGQRDGVALRRFSLVRRIRAAFSPGLPTPGPLRCQLYPPMNDSPPPWTGDIVNPYRVTPKWLQSSAIGTPPSATPGLAHRATATPSGVTPHRTFATG
jgi:Acyl-CoA dehydrogenase, C-terminal domain